MWMNSKAENTSSFLFFSVLTLSFVLLSTFTVYTQYQLLGKDYITQGTQRERHRNVLQGKAGNPWQYRILPDYIVLGFTKALKSFGARTLKRRLISFLGLRWLQNFAILLFAFLLYRQLGLSRDIALLTLPVIAWSMSMAYYDSDLQWSTYGDIAFYLLAALFLLKGKYLPLIPVTFLAALNRETSGFIPFLACYFAFFVSGGKNQKTIASCCVLIYIAVFFFLRSHFPDQNIIYAYGHRPGFDILEYNFTRLITWENLMKTFNIFPIIAAIKYSYWGRSIKRLFWLIVPAWLLVHACCAVMAETRLLLMPFYLVILPAAFASHETRDT